MPDTLRHQKTKTTYIWSLFRGDSIWLGKTFYLFFAGGGRDILNRQTEKSVTEILMAIVQIAVETEKTLKSILNKDLKMKTSKRR